MLASISSSVYLPNCRLAGTPTTRSSQRANSRRASGSVTSALASTSAEEARQGALAERPLETRRVGRHAAPLGGELRRHLEVELQAVGALVYEGLPRVGGRAGEQRAPVR